MPAGLNDIRDEPCSACPYRCDVPSGIWTEEEYAKLRDYDEPTGSQPYSAFACHATHEKICSGWAHVHTNRGNEYDLLALRLIGVDPPTKQTKIPLFASGNEAADHGERDIDNPSPEAKEFAQRLLRKYPRLTRG